MGWFHAAYAAGELDGLDGQSCPLPPKKVQVPPCPKTLSGVEVLYHMCQRLDWEAAVAEKLAYFPPTFHKDGKFTRASVFKEGLMEIANHFYKETSNPKEEWICLEINLKLLLDMGIVVLPQPEEETTKPKEDGKEEKDDNPEPVQCFQIYAGISTIIPELVKSVYPIRRGGCGTFLSLDDPVFYDPRPKTFKAKSDEKKQPRKEVTSETNKVPGVGNVPSSAKPELPVDATKKTPGRKQSKSKSGLGSMFGMKSKK